MSTTLTNGLKLPDKGSVDWYADMQNNYTILDGAVGTIAEHTTQIAGKAPAVHTHTKADITDFPVYGNTAGTICEGNDSRLSDARTPVAHTHTKSDVTDLLNSNFIPFANNSYDLGSSSYQWNNVYAAAFKGNADSATEFESNQSVTLTGTIEGTVSSKAGWTIATDFREGRGSRTTTDFYAKLASGSVSGGWNVYNAIFVCNSSERDGTCLIQLSLSVNQSGIVDSSAYARLKMRSITGLTKTRFVLVYKNDTNRVLFELYAYNPSANQGMIAKLLNEFIRNGSKQSINIQMHSGVVVNALPDDYTVINATDSPFTMDLFPLTDNTYNLGTSTNKWKTLNGVNPGALSLPDFSNADPIDFSRWDTTGAVGSNYYTPTVNGWLNISIWDRATNSIFVYRSGKERVSVFGNGSMASDGRIALLMPVQANTAYVIIIKANANSDIYAANFYPCLGNV